MRLVTYTFDGQELRDHDKEVAKAFTRQGVMLGTALGIILMGIVSIIENLLG